MTCIFSVQCNHTLGWKSKIIENLNIIQNICQEALLGLGNNV